MRTRTPLLPPLAGDHPMLLQLQAANLPEKIQTMAAELLNQLLQAQDRDSLYYMAGTSSGYALGIWAGGAVEKHDYERLFEVYKQAADARAKEKGWAW